MQYGFEYIPGFDSNDVQIEFYVSSGSRDLMNQLSNILKKQGYLCYSDGSGKTKYVLDGSKNLYETVAGMRLLLQDRQNSDVSVFDNDSEEKDWVLRRQVVNDILAENQVQASLYGYAYLSHILLLLLDSDAAISVPSKKMYADAVEKFKTTRHAVDKNINYALRKAGIRYVNKVAIANLIEQVRREYKSRSK